MKLSIRMGLKKTPFLLIKPCYSHFRTLDFVLLVKLTPRGNIICVVGSTTESRGDPTPNIHAENPNPTAAHAPKKARRATHHRAAAQWRRSVARQGKAKHYSSHIPRDQIHRGSSPAKVKASIFFSQQQSRCPILAAAFLHLHGGDRRSTRQK